MGGCARVAPLALVSVLALYARPASAKTYEVGPGKAYSSLAEVADLVSPGDVVEVSGASFQGGLVFDRSGSATAPITIRGIRNGAARPKISGGTNTVEFRANHYVFEGFEVTGGSSRCVFHHGHDIVIRDTVVHDCPGHGILGADSDSGSLTLDYVEVYASGSGDTRHPIYIATDETAYPGSVFRMQHCYVHDGNGGNNVKTRAERNEIYYNWIEGALYHEIELIGPDGQNEGLAREDSDVVGNVFRKTGKHFVARVGGDGTGQTFGRFRFVNNTFLLAQGSSAAVRVFDGIETLEMHNNVFYRQGGGAIAVLRDTEASWAKGKPIMSGSGNWLPDGSTVIPEAWTGTIVGANPGFVSADQLDFTPAEGSVLVGAGVTSTVSPAGHAFPSPLALPEFLPPARTLEAVGTARPRSQGKVDIGALSTHAGQPGGGSSTSAGAGGAGTGGGGEGASSSSSTASSSNSSSSSSSASSSGAGAGGAGGAPTDGGGEPAGSNGGNGSVGTTGGLGAGAGSSGTAGPLDPAGDPAEDDVLKADDAEGADFGSPVQGQAGCSLGADGRASSARDNLALVVAFSAFGAVASRRRKKARARVESR